MPEYPELETFSASGGRFAPDPVLDELVQRASAQSQTQKAAAPTITAPARTGQAKLAPGAEKPGFVRDLLPLLLTGLADMYVSGKTGKPTTAALGTTLELREQAEKRKERESEQASRLLQARFGATEKLLDQAGKLSARLSLMPPEAAAQAKESLLELARQNAAPGTDRILQGIFSNPETLGPLASSYMKYLPEGMGRLLFPTVLRSIETGNMDQALDQLRAASMGHVYPELFARIDRLGRNRDSFKGPIPMSVLEATMDPVEDAALLEALRGVGAYAKGLDTVKDRLAVRGFAVPGVAAEVARAEALETTKGVTGLVDKEITRALTKAGFDPRKMQPGPVSAAAIGAAKKEVEAEHLKQKGLEAAEAEKGKIRGELEAGGPSPAFKALSQPIQDYLLGKGFRQPNAAQIREAEVVVAAKGNKEALAKNVRALILSELSGREGAKAGKPFEHDPMLAHIKDADLRVLAGLDVGALVQLIQALQAGR